MVVTRNDVEETYVISSEDAHNGAGCCINSTETVVHVLYSNLHIVFILSPIHHKNKRK